MKYFRLVILLSFCSADIKLESQEILDALYQDQSWELQKITEDSLYIYKKDILEMDLAAFRVNKKVSIDPFEIINIISDIENYKFVLEPLAEIAPTSIHPILKKSYLELLNFL